MALFLRFCIEILWSQDTARRFLAMVFPCPKKTKPLDLLGYFGFVYVIQHAREALPKMTTAPLGRRIDSVASCQPIVTGCRHYPRPCLDLSSRAEVGDYPTRDSTPDIRHSDKRDRPDSKSQPHYDTRVRRAS